MGNYYLATNSPFQNAGTTNIDPTLLANLAQKTTYPPITLPVGETISGSLTLLPQVPRDSSGTTVDAGYHYDVLDYTVASMFLLGGTVTVEPGTAVGIRNDPIPGYPGLFTIAGFDLLEGSSFISLGMPAKPITYANASLVQEEPIGLWWTCSFYGDYHPAGYPDIYGNPMNVNALPPPSLNFRFSNFYSTQEGQHVWSGFSLLQGMNGSLTAAINWSMQDCNLHGGVVALGWPDLNYIALFDPSVDPTPSGSVFWENNLFDGVEICLAPTDFGSGVGVDLPLQAYNNLFRWGLLFLEPTTNSAGNWTFHDNLFERMAFEQAASSPLDYDYNAYWPCTTSDLNYWSYETGGTAAAGLTPTTTGDGTTNAVGDITLSAAPAYQTGPFGNYYLPTSSPTYNAGSQPAANAGLYHYTTRLDQTKEGDEASGHMVNIGLHYIAATNSTTAIPKDTDGDGIPDYVEDSNGNGVVDANETDWTTQYTVAGVWDPTNSIYDDIDLSGNGLVGRIKQAFGMGPFETTNPLVITQIGSPQPEIAVFEQAENWDTLTNFADVRLLVDGGSGGEAQYSGPDTNDGNATITWNTTYDAPGAHVVQEQLMYDISYYPGYPPVTVAAGPLVVVQNNNIVQFNSFYSDFTTANGAILYATTTPGSSYSIEITDTNGAHLTTIAGTTSTNIISESWNLVEDDPTNTVFGGSAFNATFTVTPPGAVSPGPQSTAQLYQTSSYTVEGDFTVAYAYSYNQGPGSGLDYCILNDAVDTLMSGDTSDDFAPRHPYPSTFNSPTEEFSKSGWLDSSAQLSALYANLQDKIGSSGNGTRNFYWYGHGSVNCLFDGANVINIPRMYVSGILGNSYNFGQPEFAHPYRFVFLDCCDAGDGLWYSSFGIPTYISYQDAETKPLEARAFLGWSGTVFSLTADTTIIDYGDNTLFMFFYLWGEEVPLKNAVYACQTIGNVNPAYDPYGLVYIDWPLGAPADFLSKSPGPNDSLHSRTRLYGYSSLTRSGIAPQ